jgi:hypothetical protein
MSTEKGKRGQEAKNMVFKRLYGVNPETFEEMKAILEKSLNGFINPAADRQN